MVGHANMYTGPIVVASQALRRRWLKSMPDDVAATLHYRSDPDKHGAATLEVGAETILLLHMSRPTRFEPIGAGGVLVRLDLHGDVDFDEDDPEQVRGALEVDFGTIKPSAWRTMKKVLFEVASPPVAFTSGAAIEDREEELSSFVDVPLKKGCYEVDVAVVTQGARTLELIRLRPRGKSLDVSAAPRAAPPKKPKNALEVSPAVARLAKRIAWVGTDGGPVIAIRKEDAAKWKAARQYEDVMDAAFGIVRSGGVDVLVLPFPDLTGFVPWAKGGVLVRCDYGPQDACVALALGAEDKAWKPTKLRMTTGAIALLSAADDGKKGKTCALAKGTYAIDLLSSATATVDGEAAAVRGCVRLRRP